MKTTSIKGWAPLVGTLIAVAVFCGLTAIVTVIFGGKFIINGVTFGLVGVCASFWYYAGTKEAPIMIKVLATTVSLMAAVVIFGMYLLV